MVASNSAPSAIRAFSDAAASEFVAPPVKQYGLAARYTGALYSAAVKAKSLDKVDKEIAQIAVMCKTSPTFKSFLSDPSVPKKKKSESIIALMTEMKFTDTTKHLFGVMASNGRLPETEKVAKLFSEIMMASKGEVPAAVTSAEPLTAKELADVTAACQASIGSGKTLKLEQKVDPSIIGGLMIDVGDKHIDLSINTKIRKMEALLQDTV
eukprot:CAMPEP_0118933270 /NCGR_PEP_ID=MMETSP1169-20130426/11862_1 /TAXON_ID=36882 /ORGANISM="Pyramimonas obovata, Strain CCMP722" /LENGTH=209 /DNA_ID=CAMNT_0006876009 /DNA_START=104 /DNA_END=733 /DNA_ORIENTATION=+